jgi:hypothetical protein
MPGTEKPDKPIWASWRVREDGSVEVTATYRDGAAYARREAVYSSLVEAAEALGPGFHDVVTRATKAGSHAGRWRP